MFFCRLKAVGVVHIKSLLHSNRHFRFTQGPKCMLALLWVLHVFSYWFQLLFRFFLFVALDVWDFEIKSLFYCRVLKWLFFSKRKGARSYSPSKRMISFPVNEHPFFYVNATGAPFRQPLGYFLFIDTCNSFASPWIQMSSSCKIMFFWCVKNKQIMLGCHRPSFTSSTFFPVALIYSLLCLSLSLSLFFCLSSV